MKMILLASSITAFPTLHYLQKNNLLGGIICPDRTTDDVLRIRDWANSLSMPFACVKKDDLFSGISGMISKTGAELILAYTFPHKIPSCLFGLVKYGFYNVHYSLLPKYKGPAPIFWQLKNGDLSGGITVHQMNEKFDDGPVLRQLAVPILKGENEGLFNSRLSHLSISIIKELLEVNFSPAPNQATPDIKLNASYFSKPTQKDITISWENQTATEIENLVNACNPYCNGAVTYFRGQPVRILEVNPTDPSGAEEAVPGTIIYADPQYGIFVMCADNNILRISIVQLTEGIFTGFKLSAIGVKAGDKFEDAAIVSVA